MSELEPVPDDVDVRRGEASLEAAARALRSARPARHVEIADRVLARTLATPRRSRMVRARAPHEQLRVSTLAITATLRHHLDAGLVGAAVGHLVLDVGRDERLAGLTVELYVQYGTDVLATGDRARALARDALAQLLGDTGPGSDDALVVATTHIHVSDVTVGDPHVVDPHDE